MSIAELIEAVEAGNAWRTLDHIDAAWDDHRERVVQVFNGSLDAAMALHEALLPDWYLLDLGELPNRDVKKWVAVVRPREEDETTRSVVERDNDPARAWLLAILRAKEAGQ